MPALGFLEEVAREAGAILMSHHGNLASVERKGARDLVTVADRESEAHVLRRIRERHPQDAVLAEETLQDQGMAPRLWIVDPLDGTTNYVHGIPHFAVSIAWYEQGEPVLACVFNPRLDTLYLAERGGGATLNGTPLACTQGTRLPDALLATGFAYRREELADSNLQHFVDFACRVRGLRRLGSAALDLCYVAEGQLDGFWELHLAPWDVAAGALVAREAGCRVTDFAGGDDWLLGGQIVCAADSLARSMRAVLGAADPRLLPGPAWESGDRPAG